MNIIILTGSGCIPRVSSRLYSETHWSRLSVLASFTPILGHCHHRHLIHLRLSLNSPSNNSCFVPRSHITPNARQVDNVPIAIDDLNELLEGITPSLLNATCYGLSPGQWCLSLFFLSLNSSSFQYMFLRLDTLFTSV